MSPYIRKFFSKEDKETIKKAILNAELDTSGEIRVHIESECKEDVLDRAAFLFKKLGMEKTNYRNGVLFYLAVQSKKFAIIGDEGINAVVPKDFWDSIKAQMAERFSAREFTTGLAEGIAETGKHLKKHFPHHIDDINELSDEISFGK